MSVTASSLPVIPAAATVPSKPPFSSLVGHEDLFGYYGAAMQKWVKTTSKQVANGATTKGSVDHTLIKAALPLLAGPVMPDGTTVNVHPNDSLLAMAFQAPAAPMSVIPPGRRALSDIAMRSLTFSSGRGAAGPLQLASRLDALVSSRTLMLTYDANASHERGNAAKRSKRESEAAAANAASVQYGAATSSWGFAPSVSAASPAVHGAGTGSIGAFKLSLKRKADDEGTGVASTFISPDTVAEGQRKKKKNKHKEEAFEV